MTVLLPPVFFVIFIALVLAVLLQLVQEKESTSDC
jgi:preprotein translocase subunit SecG